MASDRNPDVVVAAFLAQVETDIRNGVARELPDYLARYPGYENEVTAAWQRLTDAERAEDEYELAGELSPGDLFAGYEILAVRGRGGQGIVYEARDPEMQRVIALKILHRSQLWSSAAHQRFAREVHLMARLSHPGITSVFARGFENGLPWIAMQLLEGETVGARLQRQRERHGGGERAGFVEWRQAVRWVRDAAAAVAHAQAAGILHRDLKPGNLWLEADDRVRVLDFGLAVEFDDDGSKSDLTISGEHFGTPGYMAPEQLSNDFGEPSTATDVFALGVVLFEAVAGRRPYRSTSLGAYERAVLAGPPDVRVGAPQPLPRDLTALLRVALATRPSERYTDAAALGADLERVLDGRPIQAVPPGPLVRVWRWAQRETKVAAAIVGAFVVLAISLVAVSFALRSAETSAGHAAVTAAGALAQLDRYDEARRSLALCPQNRRGFVFGLLARELDNGLELTADTRAAVEAVLTRASPLAAARSGHHLHGTLAGAAFDLEVEARDSYRLAVAADERTLAVATHPDYRREVRFRVVRVDAGNGGDLQLVADWQLPSPSTRAIAFSADGHWLWAATGVVGEVGRSRLRAFGIASEELLIERMVPGAPVTAMLGLPDGQVVVGHEDGLVEIVPLSADLEPVPLAGHTAAIERLVNTPIGFSSVAADGSVRHWDVTLRGAARRLDTGEHAVVTLRWRDGQTVEVFARRRCRAVWRPRDHALLPVGDTAWPTGAPESLDRVEPGDPRAEHPFEPVVVTGSPEGLVAVALADRAATVALRCERAGVTTVAFSPDGRHLAVGHENGVVAVYGGDRRRSGWQHEVAATDRAWQRLAEQRHALYLLNEVYESAAGASGVEQDPWDALARVRLARRRVGRVWDDFAGILRLPFAARAVREMALEAVIAARAAGVDGDVIVAPLFEGFLQCGRIEEAAALLDETAASRPGERVVSPGAMLLLETLRGRSPTAEELATVHPLESVRSQLQARCDPDGAAAWTWLDETVSDGVPWPDVPDRLQAATALSPAVRERVTALHQSSIDDEVRTVMERTCHGFFSWADPPPELASALLQWTGIVAADPTPSRRAIRAAVLLRTGEPEAALAELHGLVGPDTDWDEVEPLALAVAALAELECGRIEMAQILRDRLIVRRSMAGVRSNRTILCALRELERRLP